MAATMVKGAKTLGKGGTAGAAQRNAPSRRRLGALVALAACASLAGAKAGTARAQRDHAVARLQAQARSAAELAAEASAQASALDARARTAEQRLRAAESMLQEAQRKLASVAGVGILEELSDAQEAERLGVARAFGHATNMMPPDDQRRLLAAILRAARKNGLDPLLLAAVIQIESRFDPYAVSSVGARGLMQLMPTTADWLLDSKQPMRPTALFNGPRNVELGAAYLRRLMDGFDGDLSQALVAYNAGPGVARSLVRNSKAWKRLHAYPQAVLAEYRRLLLLREDEARQIAGL